MARKNDSPVNMGTDDRIKTLKSISQKMVEAKENADAARQPIKDLKGALKAAGMDNDIFNLCHGIAVLDDDSARRTRIDKLQLCARALLGPDVEQELFPRHEVLAQSPTKAAALAEVAPPPKAVEPDPTAAEDAPPFDPDPPEDLIGAPEAAWDDGIIDADDPALDSAGTVFNAGRDAGRAGSAPEENPHEAGSAEHTLWERGRAKGAAEPVQEPEQPATEPVPAPILFDVGVKFAGTTEEKRHQAYWHGWNGTRAGIGSDALLDGRRGEIAKQIKLGIADFNGGLEPRVANLDRSVRFTAKSTGTTAPSIDGVSVLETAVLDHGVEIFRHTNANFVYAAVHALEAADLREVLSCERIMDIVRSCCPQGFAFVFALGYPPSVTGPTEEPVAVTGQPNVDAPSDGELAGAAAVDNDPFGIDPAAEEPPTDDDGTAEVRVDVLKTGDKLVIIDLEDRQPLIDAPSGYTAAVWVRAIHERFAGRLDTVTGAELKTALKQLALGKLLPPAGADTEADALFAAAV